jgi:hypothetical protein
MSYEGTVIKDSNLYILNLKTKKALIFARA